MKKSYIAVVLAAVCIAAIGFFAFGKGGIGGGKAQKVVIQNIRRMYDKNKVQVNADYLGKKIQITNELAGVQFVRKGDRLSFNSTGAYNVAEKDEYIVDLKYTYGVDQFLGGKREEIIRCYFDKSEEKALTQLTDGVDVTVVGVFDGEESPYLRIPFRLKNCKIVRVNKRVNDNDSIETLTEEANKGNIHAMIILGVKYITPGAITPQPNVREGLKWFETAAAEGDDGAQCMAGLIYGNVITKDIPKDSAKALMYYKMAAEQGGPRAMREIGQMYENGDGVPKDISEARSWYHKAMDAGGSIAEKDLKRIEGK